MNQEAVLKLIEMLGAKGADAFMWWLMIDRIAHPIIMFAGFAFLIYCARHAIIWVIKKNTMYK